MASREFTRLILIQASRTRPIVRAPDKDVFLLFMPVSSPDPIFDDLLEPSHRDGSNKWSNIGFREELTLVVSLRTLSGTVFILSAFLRNKSETDNVY